MAQDAPAPATVIPTNNQLRLCKTSGLRFHLYGDPDFTTLMKSHTVDEYGPRTIRAQFCSDRCRNLWRDTKKRRETIVEISEMMGNGGRSDKYTTIQNYRNTGYVAVMDNKTGHIVR